MTSQERTFAELARRLEPDLARDTRDLREPRRPRPLPASLLAGIATVVVVLLLGGPILLGVSVAGIVASVVGLVQLARAVAHDW